jgi:hypothetical protein
VIDPRVARSVPMTMRAVLVTVVLALAAAGCGGDEKGAPAGGSGSSGERLAGPLKFLVTGGDAFRQDRITVQPDGSAQVQTLKGTKAAKLTAEELDAVVAQLDDADLEDIPEDSLTKPPMPDALGFSFVYQGREVSTDSGSMPEGLEPLVGTFIRLVDRYGSS